MKDLSHQSTNNRTIHRTNRSLTPISMNHYKKNRKATINLKLPESSSIKQTQYSYPIIHSKLKSLTLHSSLNRINNPAQGSINKVRQSAEPLNPRALQSSRFCQNQNTKEETRCCYPDISFGKSLTPTNFHHTTKEEAITKKRGQDKKTSAGTKEQQENNPQDPDRKKCNKEKKQTQSMINEKPKIMIPL